MRPLAWSLALFLALLSRDVCGAQATDTGDSSSADALVPHRPIPGAAAAGTPLRRCASPALLGTAWPEADVLFHRDARWLGADAAYSIPLDDGRIFWLFGDTFVARTAALRRSESRVVRNTVAVQRGADPARAEMQFAWRGTTASPSSFFAEEGDRWYWPAHGIRLGRTLVVFLRRLKPTPGQGLGFAVEGWRAAIVDDASSDPLSWSVRVVAPSSAPQGIVISGGVFPDPDGAHVLAMAENVSADHRGFLVRWRIDDLAAGRLDAADWWTDRGWVAQASLGGAPAAILSDAGPESSFHQGD
ncbi:MAG: hypothetical protein ABIT01_03635, partial [Thermoanaerobaculia bacterium]